MSSEDDDMKDMVGGCCVCSDERGWDENPLVYCDGPNCQVAVHQACYGIVTVPSGPWFCRKCESQERVARVKCDLCPSRDGALKRTDQGGWAHVVCALYIPEVRFGNVTTMEPILISLIPGERFGKSCYICETSNRLSKSTAGACMQCNKPGCKQSFHVTCAQVMGLLCEEAGNMDNVKYCGYCGYHYGKLKTSRNMKIIPPFRPVSNINNPNADSPGSSSSSPEKAGSGGIGGGKSSTVSSSTNNEDKLALLSGTASSHNSNGSRNITSSSGTGGGGGDYTPAKKTGSSNSNSISPDIDLASSKNSKSNKKGSGSHSSGKSSDSSISSKSTPKIAQPVLTPATFSSSSHSNNKNTEGGDKSLTDSTTEGIGGGSGSQTNSNNKKFGKESSGGDNNKEDNFTVKLERVDNPLLKGGVSSQAKKDFSTLQLKEVVTAALDRPMSSSKYDHGSSGGGGGLTSGIDPPSSTNAGGGGGGTSSTSSSHSSSRHSHHGGGGSGDKPAPPDIKPHVTLTPIPMVRGGGSGSSPSSSRMSLTRESDDNEQQQKDNIKDSSSSGPSSSKNKSPGNSSSSSMQFHGSSSYGQKDLLDNNTTSSSKKHSSSDIMNEIPPTDKSGPPAKRSRGTSRDDDRGRKTPTKGRGGRRGSAHGGYGKRDNYNNLMDENSNEPMDTNSNSSRGSRSGPGRKPGGSRLMGKTTGDDPPAPTLSQLKAQMESSAGDGSGGVGGGGGSSSGGGVGGVLPTHMFGNALNPASSMAQRMVDTLSQEMEAVAGAVSIPDTSGISPPAPVVGIPLPGKCPVANAIVNGTSSSNSASAMIAASGSAPQTLEQLLERQWEQGSQFLMEQAQHLDIAQLLSCLNQLKQDNRALEEHVQTLVQRRDQLIAINARLSIPLGNSSALPVFNNSVTASNGHGTPPPNNNSLSSAHQQVGSSHHHHPNLPKGLQVTGPSTPSPQQHGQHELMMHATRHHREERIYHSEMQVSRAEITTVAHPTSSPATHGQAGRLNVAPYGYPGPVPGGLSSHHSQHQSSSQQHGHPHGRGDGTR